MNFDDLLSKILETANYPVDQRQEFKVTFYNYYFSKLLGEIEKVDTQGAKKLSDSLNSGDKEFQEVYENLQQNDSIRAILDKVDNEVIGQLVDDISKYATEEQKEQILAILST